MIKKDYIKAAKIVRELRSIAPQVGNIRDTDGEPIFDFTHAHVAEAAFLKLFSGNIAFDAERFSEACRKVAR